MSGYTDLIKRLTEADDFDRAQTRGFACMRMASDRVLHVDGHRGILHYDPCEISFRSRGMEVQVKGHGLRISAYSGTRLQINGTIESIGMRRTET